MIWYYIVGLYDFYSYATYKIPVNFLMLTDVIEWKKKVEPHYLWVVDSLKLLGAIVADPK